MVGLDGVKVADVRHVIQPNTPRGDWRHSDIESDVDLCCGRQWRAIEKSSWCKWWWRRCRLDAQRNDVSDDVWFENLWIELIETRVGHVRQIRILHRRSLLSRRSDWCIWLSDERSQNETDEMEIDLKMFHSLRFVSILIFTEQRTEENEEKKNRSENPATASNEFKWSEIELLISCCDIFFTYCHRIQSTRQTTLSTPAHTHTPSARYENDNWKSSSVASQLNRKCILETKRHGLLESNEKRREITSKWNGKNALFSLLFILIFIFFFINWKCANVFSSNEREKAQSDE